MSVLYEKRAQRNGMMMPIECVRRHICRSARYGNLHYHEYTELLFGLEGVAQVLIGDACLELPAGDMIIVNAKEPHNVICPNGECHFIVVKFLPQVLRAEEETVSEYSYVSLLLENAPDRQIHFTAEELRSTALPHLFLNMMEEWEQQKFGYELSLRADVARIYLHILRQWRKNNLPDMDTQSIGQQEIIHKAASYVQQHYTDLAESDVAAACGVSTAYFSRMFKRAMNIPFATYVANIRLKKAERLLLLTDYSVTDIAQAVGFSTTSYFISLFRKTHNITPHQYRAASRRNMTAAATKDADANL